MGVSCRNSQSSQITRLRKHEAPLGLLRVSCLHLSRSRTCSNQRLQVTSCSPIPVATNQKARALRLSNNGNYSLDLPAFLAFAHIAFIASDRACLKAREILRLRFTGSAAGAASD